MSLQIIKALNLYRQKTGTNKFFWVPSIAQAFLSLEVAHSFGIKVIHFFCYLSFKVCAISVQM
jgi:hypothetical protein